VTALLRCTDVARRFGGVLALDGLSLEVEEGSILGLIGPNGSGKTTFFNVLTGLYAATRGRIEFAGAEVTGLDPPSIYRAGIARTFQRSRLCLSLSMFDNVMLGNHKGLDHGLWFNLVRRGALRRQVEESWAEAATLLRVFHPPLVDRMRDAVAALPMIDRRRIEICRALVSRPRLLLLDEPSAGMTHDETMRLMDDLLQVREQLGGLSIILIEHEMTVIERVTSRCVVLNYGKKIAEGAFAEVAADAEVRKAYLGIG
jgi:branched-chain amino acid transport system ATP-binding protein